MSNQRVKIKINKMLTKELQRKYLVVTLKRLKIEVKYAIDTCNTRIGNLNSKLHQLERKEEWR